MKIEKDEIIKLASQYNIGQIKSVESIKTSGNYSFLITTDLGQYFLRLCGERNRFRSKEEIEGELDLMDKLKVNNFLSHSLILASQFFAKTAFGGYA